MKFRIHFHNLGFGYGIGIGDPFQNIGFWTEILDLFLESGMWDLFLQPITENPGNRRR